MTEPTVCDQPTSAELIRFIADLEQQLEQQTVLREAADRRLQLARLNHEDDFERLLLRGRELEAEKIKLIDEAETRLKGAATKAAEREAALASGWEDTVNNLRQQLRDARVSEVTTHRFARSARQAILDRRDQLRQHGEGLDAAATVARAEVVRLASIAEALAADEQAAEARRAAAQTRLDTLLRHEQAALLRPGGLRDSLKLGPVRRWRARARSYAPLVADISGAWTEVQDADLRCTAARTMRVRAVEVAVAAEPHASELESAAAVIRGEIEAIKRSLAALPAYQDSVLPPDEYSQWIERYDRLTDADRRAIQARQTRFAYRPLMSVILPVYNTPPTLLRQAITSVQSQLYPHWELCIADDASPNAEVREVLRSLCAADTRIKLIEREKNGHISAASNSALTLAVGEFVVLLDHDDILAEQALFEVVASLNENRDLDIIYSDEDHIDQHGLRSNPYFKTDYNHELLLGQNMISHLGVYRRDLVERIGGFRVGFEGSQDYDLALRAVDATTPARIHHIPSVLYHWRRNSQEATFSDAFMQQCINSARLALADHLARRGQPGQVIEHPLMPTWQRIKRPRPDPAPLVSIIIPTKDKAAVLKACVEGILHRTDYPHIEVIVVDHESTDPDAIELIDELKAEDRVRVLPYSGVFNYSAINNAAVREARGSLLAFLNNDVDVINAEWLDEMVSLAVLPGVGAVGAKLLYPDDRVQHAGIVLGAGGVAGHFFHLHAANDPSYFGRAELTSAVSAVTAACLVVRKEVFEEAGGFDAVNLPIAFNDVDLCLKIRECGYRNVFTPFARLYHHESLSRGSDQVPGRLEGFQREVQFMLDKWEKDLALDPFYNPNLRLWPPDFNMALPPRRMKPWNASEP